MTFAAAWLHCIATFAVILATTGSAAAGGEVVRLRFDFEAASLEVTSPDGARRFPLVEGLRPRLATFRTEIAAGGWSAGTASGLGRELLGPAAEILQLADRWEVTPPEAAPLAALIAPWHPRRPLVHEVMIWYRPAGTDPLDGPPRGSPVSGKEGDGVLALAPFLPGSDPRTDSADTLLAAFRARSRTLDLIPRNDTTAPTVAGALEEHLYSLVWLRADPSQVSSLLAPLSAGPHLLWWSRPSREQDHASRDDAFEPVSRWTAGGKSLLVDLWSRPESIVADGADRWMEAIADGEDLATATARARRALAETAGARVQDWAGWILVGEGRRTLAWREPNWLQRWLRRGKQNSH